MLQPCVVDEDRDRPDRARQTLDLVGISEIGGDRFRTELGRHRFQRLAGVVAHPQLGARLGETACRRKPDA